MRVLIVTVLLLFVGYFLYKPIHKSANVLYGISLVIGIASVLLMDKVKITEMLTHGIVGTAALYIVMITGVFKKKSELRKRFMAIRKEYSILGVILLLPHVYIYLLEFFSDLTNLDDWFGIVAFLIMIPLFITSFTTIRKKYTYSAWKKIQRWAYLAYALIYLHLLFSAEIRDLIVYSFLFVPYFIIKLINEYQGLKTKKIKANV